MEKGESLEFENRMLGFKLGVLREVIHFFCYLKGMIRLELNPNILLDFF